MKSYGVTFILWKTQKVLEYADEYIFFSRMILQLEPYFAFFYLIIIDRLYGGLNWLIECMQAFPFISLDRK